MRKQILKTADILDFLFFFTWLPSISPFPGNNNPVYLWESTTYLIWLDRYTCLSPQHRPPGPELLGQTPGQGLANHTTPFTGSAPFPGANTSPGPRQPDHSILWLNDWLVHGGHETKVKSPRLTTPRTFTEILGGASLFAEDEKLSEYKPEALVASESLPKNRPNTGKEEHRGKTF